MFDSYDMDNNDIAFEDIMNKLKSGKSQLIIELYGIWFAGGKYGCTWKVISGKFQVFQNLKIAFLEDSDTEKAIAEAAEEAEEEDADLDIDNTIHTVLPASDDDETTESEQPQQVDKPMPAVKKPTKSSKK